MSLHICSGVESIVVFAAKAKPTSLTGKSVPIPFGWLLRTICCTRGGYWLLYKSLSMWTDIPRMVLKVVFFCSLLVEKFDLLSIQCL